MSNEKPKTTEKSTTAEASVQSKDATSRHRTKSKMVQNVLLIWLDSNIDESSADCHNTTKQLRRAVHTINVYTDDQKCIEFLKTIGNEKACMIISGSLGQHVVPQVHNMCQVDSIFIFCSNQKFHEQWARDWPKIKGVFIEIGPICEALKRAAQQCEQNSMAISIMVTSGDVSQQKLNQLEPSFMYTQILKEILLSIKFEEQHINEFVQYCRDALADNECELKNLKKFARQYHNRTPIWWYTYQCFLYTMLNRALRLMDADMIIRMGFFISDLHRHIEQLHQEQFPSHDPGKSFIVYRGLGLCKADFEQISKTKGELLSFNNFLSTSKQRNVSLRFAEGALTNTEMVGVLFVMTIDPTQSNTPFASITGVSYFEDREDEVLFSMHTVFRIGEITPMDGNSHLFQVKLTLTNDNDKDLRILTDRIREETFPNSTGWFRLGLVLLKMGEFCKAQQIYEILLEQTTNEYERGRIYDLLGQVHYKKEDHQEAITFFENSLKILKETFPSNHPNLAVSYSNIGLVYDNMGSYSKALAYYKKNLEINKQSLPSNHCSLASSYNNIGAMYHCMGDYSKALSSYEDALAIRQQSLPPNHPDLALSHYNMGLLCEATGNYSEAHSFYQRAVDIGQQSLLPNHPDLRDYRKKLEKMKKKL